MLTGPTWARTGVVLAIVSASGLALAQGSRQSVREPTASVRDAMTERQARTACQRELRGSRDTRRTMALMMRNCMDDKMHGR